MSGFVLLLTLTALAALLVYLLRRWPTPSTALAALAATAVAVLLWRWPNEGSVVFLGRVIQPNVSVVILGQRLEMDSTAQWVIGFLALTLALAYVGAWRVSQGRSFFPFGLILLTLFSTVILIRPLWRASIVLAIVLTFSTLVIQAGRRGSTRGAVRVMWLPVLAIPLFLLAAWYLDQVPLDPSDPLPQQSAARLASWGLLLLLAPWPFHGPALSVGEEAPPLVAAWLLTATTVVSVTLLQGFLIRYEWLRGTTLFYGLPTVRLPELLLWGGLAMALWAGLAAAVQNNLGRLWSYAALYSYSAILIALGLGSRSSWGLVWLLILGRSIGLLVSAFGLAVVRQRAGGPSDFGSIRGLGTRLPWSSAALLVGGLSLAGLPLTVGFAAQWALLQTLGSRDWVLAAILLTGAVGLTLGLLRSQRALLGQLTNLLLEREERLMVLLATLGLLLIILPALLPQVWRDALTAAVTAFSTPPPGL